MRSVTCYAPRRHVQHRCAKSCFHKRDVISEALKCLKTYQSRRSSWRELHRQKKKLKRQTCCSRNTRQTEGTDRQNETTDDSGVSEGPISELCSHACILLCSTLNWHSSHMLKARLGNGSHQHYTLVSLVEMFYNPNPNSPTKED